MMSIFVFFSASESVFTVYDLWEVQVMNAQINFLLFLLSY